MVFGLFEGRSIYHLAVSRRPLWKELALLVVVAVLLSGMIYLREVGLWIWPTAALDALFVSMGLTIVFAILCTEAKRTVHVYFAGRGYVYVPFVKEALYLPEDHKRE